MELRELVNLIKFKENLTQKEIAARMGINKSYLQDMLGGRNPFTETAYHKMCFAFPYIKDAVVAAESLEKDSANTTPLEVKPSNKLNVSIRKELMEDLMDALYEKDKQIAEKDKQISEKDKQIEKLQDMLSKLLDK